MADLEVVQHDRKPDVLGTLTYANGAAVNLTTATSVRFQMRRAWERRYVVDAVAAVVDAANGQVRYEWAAGDLAVPPDTYKAQWEIHWPGALPQTTTPPNEIVVRRE